MLTSILIPVVEAMRKGCVRIVGDENVDSFCVRILPIFGVPLFKKLLDIFRRTKAARKNKVVLHKSD
jgi:hypothetical protein